MKTKEIDEQIKVIKDQEEQLDNTQLETLEGGAECWCLFGNSNEKTTKPVEKDIIVAEPMP